MMAVLDGQCGLPDEGAARAYLGRGRYPRLLLLLPPLLVVTYKKADTYLRDAIAIGMRHDRGIDEARCVAELPWQWKRVDFHLTRASFII